MRYYENPNKTSENRLAARSWYIPEGVAKTQTLNGVWDFKFFENGDMMDDITEWDEIEVPSCWQLKGYEHPNYVNTLYPYPCDPPYVPDVNPAAVYERNFTVDHTEFNAYLILDGVSSIAEIYLNEEYVGFTQGSRLFAEFDISKFVKPGKNRIRIIVRKWCCGSYLEDQDTFRYNGLFRDVYILYRPQGHIFDLDIRTKGNQILCKCDAPFVAKLYEKDQLIDTREGTETCQFTLENPMPWTAETPYLYTVKFFAAGEEITRKIGFRTIAISKDNELLINNTPVKLKGVNHHDTTPYGGWTMTEEEYVQDLKLMKQLNINAIRTSHYPPIPKFLDYCDEMGFYVILETDLETHGFCICNADIPGEPDWPCNNELWKKEFVERMQRAYERDKIHTSIISWSCGNESSFGDNHREMFKWIKERDTERLTHSEGASSLGFDDDADLYSRMYPSIQSLEKWGNDKDFQHPMYMCEYAHAMGNGPGGIWDYWETVLKHKKLIGGCVWEWADHVAYKDGVQCYGGDFEGELVHDRNFCCDGMVFASRECKAGTYEIKNTYAPFRIKWENGTLTIKNLFDFVSFAGYTFEYEIAVDGEALVKDTLLLETPAKGEYSFSPNVTLPESCMLGTFVTVRMYDAEGKEVGVFQEEIPTKRIPVQTGKPLILDETERFVTAKGTGFTYVISKQTGSFVSILKGDEEQLAAPVKLSYYRALTDNDIATAAAWKNEKLDKIFNKVYEAVVKENKLTITGSSSGVSRPPFFRYTLSYEFFADGQVRVELKGNIKQNTIWLPRLGFEFTVPYHHDRFRYFGNGPLESYNDMSHHGVVAWHRSSADEEYVNYVRPQEYGNHTDCRQLELEDSIRFIADDKMDIAVLHHSMESIDRAEHTNELQKSAYTHVRVDYKMSGIGTGACGPQPEEQYRLSEKDISFGMVMKI